MQAAGFLDRPSEDVDLFTAWDRRGEFEAAVVAVVDAYTADGLWVNIDLRYDTFARLYVTDDGRGETSKVEMGVDYRVREPIRMSIGPVLHPDDAVANKMGALYGRALARDFIDVDAAVCSGRYTREDLLALAAGSDGGFDRRMFADAIAQAVAIPSAKFAEYGVHGRSLEEMRARFAAWREELLAA